MSKLEQERAGGIINPDRIPLKERRKLAKHLQGRFDEDSIERFLVSVSEAVDTLEKSADAALTDSEMKKSLEQLVTMIRRLNNGLIMMDEQTLDTVAEQFKDLVSSAELNTKDLEHLRQNEPNFSEWLDHSLENIRVMDIVFHNAHSKMETNSDQPTKVTKRDFIENTVRIYMREFGEKPAAKPWFVKFMSELGKTVGIKIGKDAANKAIKKHK